MNSQRSQQRPPFHSFTVTQSRNGDVVECFYARQCPCCSQYSACQHNSLGNSSQGMCSKAKLLPTSHLTYLLSSNMAYRARLRVARLSRGWVCCRAGYVLVGPVRQASIGGPSPIPFHLAGGLAQSHLLRIQNGINIFLSLLFCSFLLFNVSYAHLIFNLCFTELTCSGEHFHRYFANPYLRYRY